MRFSNVARIFIFLFTYNRLAVLLICAGEPKTVTPNHGAIITLIRGDGGVTWNSTNCELFTRNKSYKKHFWVSDPNYDIIIFHSEDVSLNSKKFLKSETPELKIHYINVKPNFNECKTLSNISNQICPPNNITKKFSNGYKCMCHFWFVDFLQFLHGYDWILRIDDDCELIKDARRSFPPPNHVLFASSHWQLMDNNNSDAISHNFEGDVVSGLRQFTEKYAGSRRISTFKSSSWSGWRAPYTNVMFIRLDWLRGNQIIKDFMEAVDQSGCIFSNRWGDLPLWGIALMLAGEPQHLLNVQYYHGSHKTSVLHHNKVIHYA